MSEEVAHHHKKSKINVPWVLVGILAIILIASIITGGFGTITGMGTGNGDALGKKAVNDLNTQYNITAKLIDVESAYFMKFEYNNKYYGTFLNSSTGDMLTSPGEVAGPEVPFDAPNAEKPVIDLYVMSFCPYGVQAEDAMVDVVKLFGDKATIRPRFIVAVSDGEVQSLHGEYEANEDMRQACIWKNYGQATLWNYLDGFNGKCTKSNIDTCWKEVAESVDIEVSEIETCFASEGVSLVEADGQLADQNGVSGSPTLIINGMKYDGARTADSFKSAICTGFTTPPSECSQDLGNTTAAANGSC